MSISKQLIIITGISGSGKTTLSKKIQKETKMDLLSVDTYKENVAEQYGFLSTEEHTICNQLAETKFKLEVIKLCRENKSIIVEYPFSARWQFFLIM